MRPLILVTGFGPFLGLAVNPSEALARHVADVDHPTHDFVALSPLPVELEHAAERARQEAVSRSACAILALGVARSSDEIRIESTGRNRSQSNEPDARGQIASVEIILESAPATLRSPLDLRAIGRSLDANGIRWRESDDAGGYVCNDLYFRLLDAHRGGAAPPTAFVHVPLGADEIPRLRDALAEGMANALLALAQPGERIA